MQRQYVHWHLNQSFPALDQEIVPYLQQALVNHAINCVLLKDARKNCDEPCRRKQSWAEPFFFQMLLQLFIDESKQSINLIEKHFKTRELLIEHLSDTEPVHKGDQSFECHICILEHKKQQTS